MFQQNLPNDPHPFQTFAAQPYPVSRWRFLEKKPRISHPNDDLVVSRPCFLTQLVTMAGGAGNGNCAQKLCQGWQHAPQQQSHINRSWSNWSSKINVRMIQDLCWSKTNVYNVDSHACNTKTNTYIYKYTNVLVAELHFCCQLWLFLGSDWKPIE